ncbi:MAG: hypothetical protein ABEJ83_01765 [Candidatus Nanohaloarchaea archaeon]
MVDKEYNEERDILHINWGQVAESVPKGGYVIQLDGQEDIVGVEVHNASKVLSNLTQLSEEEVTELLENIVNLKTKVVSSQGVKFVAINITARIDGKEVNQNVSMEAPAAPA